MGYHLVSTLAYPSDTKNLGQLWLAHTELQGEFYILISIDSRHFAQPELSLGCRELRNHPMGISCKDVQM